MAGTGTKHLQCYRTNAVTSVCLTSTSFGIVRRRRMRSHGDSMVIAQTWPMIQILGFVGGSRMSRLPMVENVPCPRLFLLISRRREAGREHADQKKPKATRLPKQAAKAKAGQDQEGCVLWLGRVIWSAFKTGLP